MHRRRLYRERDAINRTPIEPLARLSAAISRYQKKIGKYDKQSWERTVEKRMLRGFSNVPKKSAKPKIDLFDVDVLRGSTFSKTKPELGMIAVTRQGLLRVLFLPFYITWWQQKTNREMSLALMLLYLLQVALLLVYFLNSSDEDLKDVSSSLVLSPVLIIAILGVIHAQVVATNIPSTEIDRCKRLKRKRTKRRSYTKIQNSRRSSKLNSASSQSDSAFQSRANESLVIESTSSSQSSDVLNIKHSHSFSLNIAATNENKVQNTVSECSVDCCQSVETNVTSNENNKFSINGSSNALSSTFGNEIGGAEVAEKDADSNGSVSSGIPAQKDQLQVPNNLHEDFTDERSDEAKHDSAVHDMSSLEMETDQLLSDNEGEKNSQNYLRNEFKFGMRRRNPQSLLLPARNHCVASSCESDGETTCPDTPVKDTASDYWGNTTNTDYDQSYETDQTEELNDAPLELQEDFLAWDVGGVPVSSVLNASHTTSDKVSCAIWEGGECKKADLTMLDISSAVVQKVDQMPENTDYLLFGIGFAILLGLMPVAYRVQGDTREILTDIASDIFNFSLPNSNNVKMATDALTVIIFGKTYRSAFVQIVAMIQRFCLSMLFFFLLTVAERTFKQRFLYAKLFSNLTSSRQARKLELPHFRLNKVRNIKTWLAVRSYLKKHGPQRSVDVIVSATFVIALVLISILCVQFLKENDQCSQQLYHWEILAWCLALGVYLLRYMTLGAKINKKYRNLSVLLTEQINLYVQMEQKPEKKEGLVLANNVLKLAAELLKELESPFKISGLSANPFLYNATKLVILSAFSAILTEILGFKLKLYKLKIK